MLLHKNHINGLNLVRLIAAIAVVISHAWVMGFHSPLLEPLAETTAFYMGQHAVNIFFLISGFLIARSWENKKSSLQFAISRIFRIYPALIAMLIVLTLTIGFFISADPALFFANSDNYIAPVKTLILLNGHLSYEGIFTNHAVADLANNPLWTLKYEVICYTLLAVTGIITGRYFRFVITVFFAISSVAFIWLYLDPTWQENGTPWHHLSRFISVFTLGAILYFYRDKLVLGYRAILLTLLIMGIANMTALAPAISAWGLGYICLIMGLRAPNLPFRNITAQHDMSYGIYIFGWPITQILVSLNPEITHNALVIASVAFAIPVAMLSWALIEKPSMAFGRNLNFYLQMRESKMDASDQEYPKTNII